MRIMVVCAMRIEAPNTWWRLPLVYVLFVVGLVRKSADCGWIVLGGASVSATIEEKCDGRDD